jgi:hypothetical protein
LDLAALQSVRSELLILTKPIPRLSSVALYFFILATFGDPKYQQELDQPCKGKDESNGLRDEWAASMAGSPVRLRNMRINFMFFQMF